MAKHLDEMQSYIKIAGSCGFQEDEFLSEDIVASPFQTISDNTLIIDELNSLVFKLKSYRELNENQNYALGVEEGFNLAAEMLERVVEKYQANLDE